MAATPEQVFLDQVRQHAGILVKVIRLYVDDAEDQRDLQQEILYQAWKSYPRFRGEARFSTWLYRIALNTVLSYRRKPPLPPTDLLPEAGAHSDRYADSQLLLWAMRHLSEIDRMVLALHLDGYDNSEVAGITGLSANHVAVKLHRSKKRLSQLIQQENA